MQSMILPHVIESSITLCFHVAFSWLLVSKSELACLEMHFLLVLYTPLVECDYTWTIYEILFWLWKNSGSNFNGVIPWNRRVLSLFYPFSRNDLV